MTTTLEIFDTAVKIGLGAAISAVAGLVLAKINQIGERDKAFSARRLDRLEKVSTELNDYLNALSYLISAIDGVRRTNPGVAALDIENEDHSKAYKFIQENDLEYCKKRANIAHIYATLRLLKVEKANSALDDAQALDEEIRQPTLFERKIPTGEVTKKWFVKVTTIRTAFFDAIAEEYRA